VSAPAPLEAGRRLDALGHDQLDALVALAQARLEEDPTEALALATASLELADTEEARTFVMRALWEAPPARELEMPGGAATAIHLGFSPDGERLAVSGFKREVWVRADDGTEPLVLLGQEPPAFVPTRVGWASTGLLVTGPSVASRVDVWAFPGGRRLRTIEFGGESWWQVGPHHLLEEAIKSRTPDGDMEVLVLRSRRLPDGEPEVLGQVDVAALGSSTSGFQSDGRSWIYLKGRSLYRRPLPFSEETQDELLTTHEAPVRRWGVRPGPPEQLYSLDESGQIQLWSLSASPPALLAKLTVSDDAPQGIEPDPSGQWIAVEQGKPGRAPER
jgi:hypothetical protein